MDGHLPVVEKEVFMKKIIRMDPKRKVKRTIKGAESPAKRVAKEVRPIGSLFYRALRVMRGALKYDFR
jgi:hypothetical protein